ncbi:TatD family hydrolase [Candidatus Woesearchaeota archaeon]|nr:TatD family hydrolase [Candidatus Woesearchaeota archaeon]
MISMMFIDIHSHLDLFSEDEIGVVIRNAERSGLKHILGSGICPESNRRILELSKRFGIVRPSVGLYPIDALAAEKKGTSAIEKSTPAEDKGMSAAEKGMSAEGWGRQQELYIDAEIDLIRSRKDYISAIGEIGLDYKTGKDKEGQKRLFKRMLALAKELDKPVIIHSRKAEADVIEILEECNAKKVVMHCFCGKKRLLFRAIKNGWYFSVPTNVVRSEQAQFLAREVPLSHLFCETDSPFLSPYPDKRNEPAFVVESYRMVAEIKKQDIAEVGKNVYMNWQRLFLGFGFLVLSFGFFLSY